MESIKTDVDKKVVRFFAQLDPDVHALIKSRAALYKMTNSEFLEFLIKSLINYEKLKGEVKDGQNADNASTSEDPTAHE